VIKYGLSEKTVRWSAVEPHGVKSSCAEVTGGRGMRTTREPEEKGTLHGDEHKEIQRITEVIIKERLMSVSCSEFVGLPFMGIFP
jgi:hypothetical protein